MGKELHPRRDWRASIGIGAFAVVGIISIILLDPYLFGRHDPQNLRAYFCGGTVATLAALAIGMGIRSIEVRENKPGAAIGMILGTLALLTSALFLLGTMLPGD